MPKQWNILPTNSKDLKKQLLFNRGINGAVAEEKFFHPEIMDYKELLEIHGIDQAKQRITEAIGRDETIFIYGDYDVDGVTASAIMYRALKSLGAKVLPYIPHREKEGYGLSQLGLDEVKRQDGKLIITVDNGIVALEQTKYAKELGLDIIITDHHAPLEILPPADIIIHSTKMCGAGVAWCLARTLVPKDFAQELLQFVALGTIADLIPLTGLGRAFVCKGLEQLRNTKIVGLKALAVESGITLKNIGDFEAGFILCPRLNAIGRLQHAMDALRLLCTNDLLKATRLAKLLADTNTQRQNLTREAFEEARLMVKSDQKVHIINSDRWVPGIIGLVASQICEEYGQPVIAISVGEEISKGSARSVHGVNITQSIRNFSDILIDVGGHEGAAGFSLYTKDLEIFRQRIEQYFLALEYEKIEPVLDIEAVLESRDLNMKNAQLVEEFAPFGVGNQRPIFASRDLTISDLRRLSDGKHLKCKLNGIDAIGFGMGHLYDDLIEGETIDSAFYLEINKFNGKEIVQLKLKDIHKRPN